MVSKFHNGIHDSKGYENKIKTIVKSRARFYRRHTVLVPVTSCSEVIYVFNLLTLILKQKASPKCGCLNLHDITLYIIYTNIKVGTNLSAVQLLSEFGKSLSNPIPFKMKSYAKLSNNVSKYPKPTDHVLLWMILI